MAVKPIDQLIEEALDAFDDPESSVAGLVRRAIRIATKRQDYLALVRLLPETFDLTVGSKIDNPAFVEARTNLAALLGRDLADQQIVAAMLRYQRDRATEGSDKQHGQSIGQLEANLREINDVADSYRKVPENLTPIDTYFVARDYDAASAKLLPLRTDLAKVIERVRQATHDILVDMERQIELGQSRPTIFDRAREYVEGALTKRAPDALEKFVAAEEALASGGPEDLAHALTSCRRMIKALADALYPSSNAVITGEDGLERAMTDDAYRNRLLQYVIDQVGGSTHRDFVKETLRSLGGRLERLNELSSKGVHGEVTRAEAETCVMWTYLTAADFLRIADGSSPRLTADDEE